MLKDVVAYLVNLGKETTRLDVIPCPWNPHLTLAIDTEGEIVEYEAENPCRAHSVSNLASLQIGMKKYQSDGVMVWVSFEEVVAILDDNHHRNNSITLNLSPNPMFSALESFGKKKDPKELYRFLKFDCKDSAIEPADLDLLISNLKFRTEDEVNRTVGKNADAMGQSIRSEVTGADKIPDLVSFSFLPWPAIEEEFQAEVTVPCQLYIDPSERTLTLKPLAGATDAAKTAAVSNLAESISKWGAPVLCGTP